MKIEGLVFVKCLKQYTICPNSEVQYGKEEVQYALNINKTEAVLLLELTASPYGLCSLCLLSEGIH